MHDALAGMGQCLKLRIRRDFSWHKREGQLEPRSSTDTAWEIFWAGTALSESLSNIQYSCVRVPLCRGIHTAGACFSCRNTVCHRCPRATLPLLWFGTASLRLPSRTTNCSLALHEASPRPPFNTACRRAASLGATLMQSPSPAIRFAAGDVVPFPVVACRLLLRSPQAANRERNCAGLPGSGLTFVSCGTVCRIRTRLSAST